MNKAKKTFSSQIFLTGIYYNLFSGLIIFILSAFFIRIKLSQAPVVILCGVSIIIISEFLIAPFTHKIITTRISNALEAWKESPVFTSKDRTLLIEQLHKYPLRKAIETWLVFTSGSIIICLLYHYLPGIKIDTKNCLIALVACLYCAYNCCISSYYYAEKKVNKIAKEIFREGVDFDYVNKKKFFGMSIKIRCVVYLMIPILFANFMLFFAYCQSYMTVNGKEPDPNVQLIRIAALTTFIFILCIYMAVIFFKQIRDDNSQMASTIEKVVTEGNTNITKECTLCNELQYNLYLLNNTINRYKFLITKASGIGNKLQKNTEDLSVLSQEFAATSISQNKTVQDVKESAQFQKTISLDIQDRMNAVTGKIEQTSIDVEQSFALLDESISQMQKITTNNIENTQRIKNLSHQIDNIDDILIMIKEIADQTRIIAFNAELEAVSAKEEGKNFHIVAAEIRRLANSTMNSIHEIQSNIENIQNASLALIVSSENETNYIKDETEITKELEKHFSNIQSSSEETNEKSLEINEIIQQQTSAFEGITVTLAQISEGFMQFTESTKTISNTTHAMQERASQLSGM